MVAIGFYQEMVLIYFIFLITIKKVFYSILRTAQRVLVFPLSVSISVLKKAPLYWSLSYQRCHSQLDDTHQIKKL